MPDVQPYLEFYDRLSGEWRLRVTAPTWEDFRAGTFFIQQITSGVATESWWLASGVKFGDTGSRLVVRLYAYDGSVVRVIWKRDELVRGDLLATGDTVTLEYDPEYKPRHPMARIHEVYRATPNGLIQSQ